MEQLPQIIHESWHQHLQPLFDDPKMILIRTKVLPQCQFYPERHLIFKVFEMPIDQIKVVILGQDPYPNGQAVGLAFAVNMATTKEPASLRIIRGEVDRSENRFYTKRGEDYSWKTLQHWVNQGVFLLNTALTVEVGIAGSHLGVWNWFTRSVVNIISNQTRPIWLMWGAKAKAFSSFINKPLIITTVDTIDLVSTVDNTYNPILVADHPAAETYPGSKSKFSGCNHFNLCNQILAQKNKTLINW